MKTLAIIGLVTYLVGGSIWTTKGAEKHGSDWYKTNK